MSQSRDNRRHSPRIERINLVQVSRFDEEGLPSDLATGRTLNLSEGGLRIELPRPLPLRSKASFTLILGERMLDLQGTVVYLEALDNDLFQVGIRFDSLDPAARLALKEHVEASP